MMATQVQKKSVRQEVQDLLKEILKSKIDLGIIKRSHRKCSVK